MKKTKILIFILVTVLLFSCGDNQRNYKRQLQTNSWYLQISSEKMKNKIDDIIEKSDKVFVISVLEIIKTIVPDTMKGFTIKFSKSKISFLILNRVIKEFNYRHSDECVKSLIIDVEKYSIVLNTDIDNNKLIVKTIEFNFDKDLSFSYNTEFLSFDIVQQLR